MERQMRLYDERVPDYKADEIFAYFNANGIYYEFEELEGDNDADVYYNIHIEYLESGK